MPMLMQCSERKNLDVVGARGWDEGETAGVKGFSKAALQKTGVRFAGDDDDDESGEFESYCSGDGIEHGKEGGGENIDAMFDRMLEEYGSDDMGDLADDVSLKYRG